ncbi:hypothetical protein [Microcoleus sp. bin38.metabat.b11b12b14.051]|uniref:hypothetical protein n=1 Tax=Microcoleus sp. bin38.metabat.b11b12b14.051 TaxID=2742709 RepID=UPI0025D65395|nr:hypothetical protein [Microcoleus sp. bin38.metabat.b11b12b14.051]
MIADISLADIVAKKSFFPSRQRSPQFSTRLATTATGTRYSVIMLAVQLSSPLLAIADRLTTPQSQCHTPTLMLKTATNPSRCPVLDPTTTPIAPDK